MTSSTAFRFETENNCTLFSGTIVPELLDLVQHGIVRFVDLVFIRKDEDGSTQSLELNDLDEESYRIFVPMGVNDESLFSQEDLELAASRLPNNCSGALFLWENLWAEHLRHTSHPLQRPVHAFYKKRKPGMLSNLCIHN